MRKLDEHKLDKLHTAGELLDNKYGEVGTDSRTAFHEKSIAWYYGEILRDRRKELKITQQELAEKVGTARSYIARVEKERLIYRFRASFVLLVLWVLSLLLHFYDY